MDRRKGGIRFKSYPMQAIWPLVDSLFYVRVYKNMYVYA